MKIETVEKNYDIQAWNYPGYPKRWSFMCCRKSLKEARDKADDLRKRWYFKVRILEHRHTSRVVK